MDDIIYTLLIVAWVAYGIFSAVKKNKAKGEIPTAQAKPQSKDTVESLLESLFEVSSPNPLVTHHPYSPIEYVDENQPIEEEEYRESDYLDVLPEMSTESKIDTYSGTDNIQPAIVDDDVDEELEYDEIKNSAIDNATLEDDESVLFTFDLRQAVISQVILERPYQ